MRIKLEDLPEAARKRVEREIGTGCGVDRGKAKTPPRGRFSGVREDSPKRLDRLNKTERRFLDEFLCIPFGNTVIVQPPRFFELTGGGTYTPDFMVFSFGFASVYEVKGGYMGAGWEQGIERYKRAAAQYDCGTIRFCLAEWVRSEKRWVLTWWR